MEYGLEGPPKMKFSGGVGNVYEDFLHTKPENQYDSLSIIDKRSSTDPSYQRENAHYGNSMYRGRRTFNAGETSPNGFCTTTKKILFLVIAIIAILALAAVVMYVLLSRKSDGNDFTSSTVSTPRFGANTDTPTSKTTDIKATTADTYTVDTSTVTLRSTTDISAGNWSLWGDWTQCSSTCASGIHKRYRQCIASPCIGDYVQTEICTSSPCPVFGKWTTWASWSACDVSCGGGAQTRTRECQKNDPSDIDCVGGNTQQQPCSTWDCPDCSKTCSVGTLNGECDTCECSLTTKGRVLATSSRNPVTGASIFAATAPTRPLAITNSTGFFILETTCTGTDIIIKKDGYNDCLTQITTESYVLNISKIVTPHFTQTPMSKKRLVGESLTLCCLADGLPKISYYEWFQDSQLLDTALYPNETVLNIDNVDETHSGQYQCRANSPAGAIMSTAANIQIREDPGDFCTDSLQQKAIDLPSDCVQEATNTATYDVGECISKSCRQNGSIDARQCGEGTSSSCCSVEEAKLETVQCSGYTMQVVVVNKCGCGPCSPTTYTISGRALSALDNTPAPYLYVYVNGEFNSYTDQRGYFTVTVEMYASPLTLYIVDKYYEKFLPAVKQITSYVGLSGTMKVKVYLVPVASTIEIEASIENTLNARSEANTSAPNVEIVIPAGSFYDENGVYYNGTVSARFTFLDTSNISNIEQLPGMFRSLDAEGETNNLDSLGVFNLFFQDNAGNRLTLVEEIKIKFPVNISPDIVYKDFKLWSLNTNTGVWEQLSISSQSSKRKKRQLSSLEWIGNINLSDFESSKWFNIDKISNFYKTVCYFKTRFYKDKNLTQPIIPEREYKVETVSTENGILRLFYGYVKHPEDECMPVGCERNNNIYISSYYYGRADYEHLYAAGPAINTVQYFNIQEDEKAIEISIQPSLNGPFYDNETVCLVSSNPLQFHHGYTGPSRSIPVQLCYPFASVHPPEREVLCRTVWYPYRNEEGYVKDGYKVCKAKVKVSLGVGYLLSPGQFISLKVTSYGGNKSEIGNKTLGVLEYDIVPNDVYNIICVEYKCSGMYDPGFGNNFDNTEVKIVLKYPHSDFQCKVAEESEDLLDMNGYTQVNRSDGIYEFVAPDTYGSNNGLYSATSGLTGEVINVNFLENEQDASALKCLNAEQITGKNVIVDGGYAVHFRCY